MADNAGIGDQALDIGVVEAARRRRSRNSAKPRAEILALAQDGEPGQARLEALEAELLEQAPVLGDRPAPFGVVIGLVVGKAARPPAARPAIRPFDQSIRQRHSSPRSMFVPFSGAGFRPLQPRRRLPDGNHAAPRKRRVHPFFLRAVPHFSPRSRAARCDPRRRHDPLHPATPSPRRLVSSTSMRSLTLAVAVAAIAALPALCRGRRRPLRAAAAGAAEPGPGRAVAAAAQARQEAAGDLAADAAHAAAPAAPPAARLKPAPTVVSSVTPAPMLQQKKAGKQVSRQFDPAFLPTMVAYSGNRSRARS